ncbi:glycosyltransferase family 4 protein [Asticcacaulis sp. W401b]|uniref:glycosyltransferase family 4 protein n=1 Tax=Asticcacaulis sp. W401b TaxID=3388666 RepID=UPI0039709F24
MKVIYLSPYFWPEVIGSAKYCTDVAQYLAGRKHDVIAYAFRPHYPTVDGFEAWRDGSRDKERYEGITLYRVPSVQRKNGGFGARFKNDFTFFSRIVIAAFSKESQGADVVVAYIPSILTALSGYIISLIRGARLIVVVHDIESGLAKSLGIVTMPLLVKFMSFLEKIVLNRADRIIVLTDGMRKYLIRNGVRREIIVLPIWSTLSELKSEQKKSISIGYSGNFGKKQNIDQILPLIKDIGDKYSNSQIILRGNGSEKARIIQEIDKFDIKNVQFLDLAPTEKLSAALQEIDIHLVPQAVDTGDYAVPSKLVSIMAVGRPFVCIAEAGSTIDMISKESGAGICVPNGNYAMLFSAVAELFEDSEKRSEMGRKGQDYVRLHLDREIIMEKYAGVIEG